MNKKRTLIALTLLACCITPLPAVKAAQKLHQTLFMGTIQWPMDLKKVPSIRIYHAGRQLTGEANHETRQITYAVPELSSIQMMTLIITDPQNIKLQMADDNTIKYLAVANNASYKCFQFTRIHNEPTTKSTDDSKKTLPTESWEINQRKLSTSGKIPDDALILCCNSDLISKVSGGNSIDLPTIYMCDDLLKKSSSEQELHEAADLNLLSCLNLDTIHTKLTFDIKQHQKKNLVAFNIM